MRFAGETIQVEVAYALPDQQQLIALSLPVGATLGDALAASGLLASVAAGVELRFGIYGRRCERDTLLADGDRVEIYRPLHFDPMESRRRRAAKVAS